MNRSRTFVALGLLSGWFSAIPAHAKELVVYLQYRPTKAVAEHRPDSALTALTTPLNWLMSTASEPPGSAIGENRESSQPVRVLAGGAPGGTPITRFVHEAFDAQFRQWGGTISPQAEVSLQGELVQFQVLETHRYHTDITMRFIVLRKQEKVWEGVVSAQNKKFGRSLSAENYNETLSDALQELFAKLISDPGFQRAWTGRAAATAAGPEATGSSAQTIAEIRQAEALEKVLTLQKEGFNEDTQAAWIRSVRVAPSLTPEDMIAWKKAGVSQKVIEAALTR